MEINGLPLHPLAVHAAVVLAPLAALLALAYVARPAWRSGLRLPFLASVVVAVGSVVVAFWSGGSFREANDFFADNAQIDQHEERADLLLWVTAGFAVLALAATFGPGRAGRVGRFVRLLLALAALAVLVLVFLTGEAGARAVWGNGFAG